MCSINRLYCLKIFQTLFQIIEGTNKQGLENQGFIVYVAVWFAVVFGINSASNASKKIVIVRGAAEHYYNFIIPITTVSHTVTNQSHVVVNFACCLFNLFYGRSHLIH